MIVEALWRPEDERAQEQLERAFAGEDLAGALLAIEGIDEEQQREVREAIDALIHQAKAILEVSPEPTTAQFTRALQKTLRGFQGDNEDYHAPHNSHLSRVLRRRRGLPILLSSLWILVGEGLDAQVQGVGLPGHFIARVGGERGQLVDPFSGGATLDQEACERIVARVSRGKTLFREEFLRSVSLQELLIRVLRNLVNAHRMHRDPAALYRVARLWGALCPDLAEPRALIVQIEETLSLRRPRGQAN